MPKTAFIAVDLPGAIGPTMTAISPISTAIVHRAEYWPLAIATRSSFHRSRTARRERGGLLPPGLTGARAWPLGFATIGPCCPIAIWVCSCQFLSFGIKAAHRDQSRGHRNFRLSKPLAAAARLVPHRGAMQSAVRLMLTTSLVLEPGAQIGLDHLLLALISGGP